jgi:purine-nucleoside phosphorylase
MAGDLRKKIKEAADYLRNAGVKDPEAGIILGTGLNNYADRIEDSIIIPYNNIPNMHSGNVDSHRGQIIYGRCRGKMVIILAGRYHYYESGDIQAAAFPARVLVELGIRRLIITNAAGCVNRNWRPGTLMLIKDHINLSGSNPLIGPNPDEFGPRFPDMSRAYHRGLSELIRQAAEECCIPLKKGVYMIFNGPSFETPAEIRMARILGADAVGMSTVPEAIVAAQCGIKCLGISCITNLAAGVSPNKLSHQEVMETAAKAHDRFHSLLELILKTV